MKSKCQISHLYIILVCYNSSSNRYQFTSNGKLTKNLAFLKLQDTDFYLNSFSLIQETSPIKFLHLILPYLIQTYNFFPNIFIHMLTPKLSSTFKLNQIIIKLNANNLNVFD